MFKEPHFKVPYILLLQMQKCLGSLMILLDPKTNKIIGVFSSSYFIFDKYKIVVI